MRIFISGGCKNGKSTYGQDLAFAMQQPGKQLYYVATMLPHDEEDHARIRRHIRERDGMGFLTAEIPLQIRDLLDVGSSEDSFLLDSLTALLSNEMFRDGAVDETAPGRIMDELSQVLETKQNLVLVSDYIYSDAVTYDPLTEAYRKGLADIDRLAAAKSDVVLEIVFGNMVVHKGMDLLKTLTEQEGAK